jgi:hypothetical protein
MTSALPPGWRHGTLANVIASISTGVSVNGEDRPAVEGEIGVLKITAVLRGVFEPEHHKAVVAADLHRVACPVRGGTVLVSRSNTAELVGSSAYVPEDVPGLFLPDKLWAITSAENINPRWLACVLSDPAFRPLLTAASNGTSGSMKNIPQEAFLRLPIIIPPVSEQDRIVEIVQTWERGIALAEALCVQLEKHLTSARHASMVALGGDAVRLGDVATVTTGQPAPQQREVFADDGVRFYRVSDLGFICGETDEEDPEFIERGVGSSLGLREFPPNTVVFAKSGASATLGRVGRTPREAFLVSHLCAIVAEDNRVASLIYHRLAHRPPVDLIQGDGFPSIRTSEVAELLVPELDGPDAPAIVEFLDDAERRLRSARQLVVRLRQQRAGLLRVLLTGRRIGSDTSAALESVHA